MFLVIQLGLEAQSCWLETKNLKTLNIALNHIGDVGAQVLAQNTNLQYLDISANHIGDEIKVFTQNATLKHVKALFNFNVTPIKV
jgi:hypothetical protein